MTSKNIYPDVIKKSMPDFDKMFADQIEEYNQATVGNVERLSDEAV